MKQHYDDFSEPLIEEVLMDVAGNFFGTRKQLDDMIELFQLFVEAFQEKEARVAARAGFLNNMLLTQEAAASLYESLKIESPEILLKGTFPGRPLPDEIPFAFTAKGKFIRIVLWAYDALQQACDGYINGSNAPLYGQEVKEHNVYYNLLRNMCDLINEKVHFVNNEMSPLSVLQFARKFDGEIECKQQVTGGMTFCGSDINDKLAYQPIDFDTLKITKYPELPKRDEVFSEITAFCKKNYSENKGEIKHLLADLKGKIHEANLRFRKK